MENTYEVVRPFSTSLNVVARSEDYLFALRIDFALNLKFQWKMDNESLTVTPLNLLRNKFTKFGKTYFGLLAPEQLHRSVYFLLLSFFQRRRKEKLLELRHFRLFAYR